VLALSTIGWIVIATIGVVALIAIGVFLLDKGILPDTIERYPSGRIRARGLHVRGDRQHWWTFWHEDGWKQYEGEYIAGFESGIWTFYHPNGRPCARGEMDCWRRLGVWEFWDEDGRPLDEATFQGQYADLTMPPPRPAS
jgi:hypothetical protein